MPFATKSFSLEVFTHNCSDRLAQPLFDRSLPPKNFPFVKRRVGKTVTREEPRKTNNPRLELFHFYPLSLFTYCCHHVCSHRRTSIMVRSFDCAPHSAQYRKPNGS